MIVSGLCVSKDLVIYSFFFKRDNSSLIAFVVCVKRPLQKREAFTAFSIDFGVQAYWAKLTCHPFRSCK